MKRIFLITLIVMFASSLEIIYPATIYVPDDYPEIQDAVNATSSGDTV